MTESVDPSAPPSGTGCVEVMPPAVGGCTCAGVRRMRAHRLLCDDSPMRLRRRPLSGSGHPIIRSFEPGEDWFWDYRSNRYYKARNSPAGKPTAGRDRSRPTRPGTRRLGGDPAQPGGLNLPRRPAAQTDHGVDAVAAAERSERVVVDHDPLLRSTDEPHATKATGAPRDPGKPEPSRVEVQADLTLVEDDEVANGEQPTGIGPLLTADDQRVVSEPRHPSMVSDRPAMRGEHTPCSARKSGCRSISLPNSTAIFSAKAVTARSGRSMTVNCR